MGSMLESHEHVFKEICLYRAIRNVQYVIRQSPYHLFSQLDMFNFETDIFFIPVGELGLAFHEMLEVSVLSMGEVPYEKCVPTTRS